KREAGFGRARQHGRHRSTRVPALPRVIAEQHMGYSARVLLDSQSPAGVRLTTLEVTFPRFVLSEFNTHRTFCLDGDTELYFDLPAKSKNCATRRFTMTLREFHEKWNYGAAPRRNKKKAKTSQAIDPARSYTARELASAAGYADYTGI